MTEADVNPALFTQEEIAQIVAEQWSAERLRAVALVKREIPWR